MSLYLLNKLILLAFQNGFITQCPAGDQTKYIFGINKFASSWSSTNLC